jgi:hypothetical protein
LSKPLPCVLPTIGGDCSPGTSPPKIFFRGWFKIDVYDDLTGFNWSKIPVVLVEMGFMTNIQEDSLLNSGNYQNKIAQGIVEGLVLYFLHENITM